MLARLPPPGKPVSSAGHHHRKPRNSRVAGTVAVQRGGTQPADGGTRNRLSSWPGSVHVDQLRQRTLWITTSLVTEPFSFFVGPRTIPQAGSRESRLVPTEARASV